MKLPLSERAFATWLAAPTIVVVILLAIVQYRWSEQVSSATSVRLADSLQMSMMGWHLDLYRNLSDISQRMALVSTNVDRRDLESAVVRFDTMQAAAKYPDLVSGIGLVGEDTAAPPLGWNRSTHQFAPAPNAASLTAIRKSLADEITRSAASPTTRLPIPDHERDWRFDPDGPRLLRPIATSASLFDISAPSGRTIEGWLVVSLDRAVLNQQLLPELAARYFTGIDGLDYQVALVAGTNPRQVIYASDPSFASEEVVDADGTINVFGHALDQGGGSSIRVFEKRTASIAPPIAVMTSWFPLLISTPSRDDWQLVVRHRRGGPLGDFLAQIRRRDLAISFSLLLLLVLTMVVWLIVVNRAQRLARLQMNFVAAVSHDLRTPLTVIASAADNIAHGLVREPEQLAQYSATIGRQARKLADLVDRVLLFAATRESRPRYSPQPIEIGVAIDAALEATAELIQSARITVDRQIEAGLPSVMGDPVGLLQCLQNLITNAIKYGGEPRWLGIRAALESSETGAEIQVSVCDRGIGMSSADQRQIFTPFFRSASIADTIRGTGLGLAVARSVAEAMNGRLTVVSAPGEGSTFTLHIPAAKASRAPGAADLPATS